MTSTELDDILSLIGQVLPDPSGFARRLVEQAVLRFGAGEGSPLGSAQPGADRFGSSYDEQPRTVVITPDVAIRPYEQLADSNALVAAALGACECWGVEPDCPLCAGLGSSGWRAPDVGLFEILVGPAVERLSRGPATADWLRQDLEHTTEDPERESDAGRDPAQRNPATTGDRS